MEDAMEIFRGVPLWKKYGLIFSSIYLILSLLLFIGSIIGIGGRGEGNLLVWILVFTLMLPASLLNLIGIEIVISTSALLLVLINMVIFFAIGSLLGILLTQSKRS